MVPHGSKQIRRAYDMRLQHWDIVNTGFPGGRFSFNGSYTRASNSAATNDRAQSWAQFLLGLPTAGTGAVATPGTTSSQFEIAAKGSYDQWSHAVYVQDDWRVNSKLTVNLGLRYLLRQSHRGNRPGELRSQSDRRGCSLEFLGEGRGQVRRRLDL